MDNEKGGGLHPQIQHNIAKSEIEGGVWLKDVAIGKTLLVQTRNTLYYLHRDTEDVWMIRGHRKYCPEWTRVWVNGSTWGGSMLKMKFIGRGMHMEFHVENWPMITTTEIQTIDEE